MELGTVNVKVNGAALREIRKLAGFSGEGLAEAVGCSGAYVSLLETDPDRSCSPGMFARICDALRLDDRTVLLRTPREAQEEAAA